jgi:hypothetical protein
VMVVAEVADGPMPAQCIGLFSVKVDWSTPLVQGRWP